MDGWNLRTPAGIDVEHVIAPAFFGDGTTGLQGLRVDDRKGAGGQAGLFTADVIKNFALMDSPNRQGLVHVGFEGCRTGLGVA